MGKYFNDNIILPNPGISDLEPRILSLIVVDIKTRRLASLTNGVFEEPLQTAGIPTQYSCSRSFATWDVRYRTLHSYNLIWAVCHLFPQRWQTLYVQSRETIGQEDHVICLQLRRRAKIQVLRLEPLIRRFFL